MIRAFFDELSTSGVSFNNKNQFAVSFCGYDIYMFDVNRATPPDGIN